MPPTLRAPSSTQPSPSTHTLAIHPPTLTWLSGPWNITHSTLPMWKKSRNVQITYTPIPTTTTPSTSTNLDDLVTYQTSTSTALKSVRGIDKPDQHTTADQNHTSPTEIAHNNVEEPRASLAYNWRGKGWLMIASSKWEILGYGEEEEGSTTERNSWMVTFFAKTLFTPAGVDLYSRKGRLRPQTVEAIKEALSGLGGRVGELAGELFEVEMDGGRE
ncbi:hypothetical protein BDW02DRAFT_33076 [Decorospora gaudefroyi]|uniref:Uncharacterized protein n=1 Tax=Decorospora gaudefroyi TaxID=184978 RepID=A0A6A5KPX5_9PLEO|nr:hypothetical protein BDW02DRAFT_33076 [Decorospora gaudefroyi]